MARIDRARLDGGRFRVVDLVPTRYDDVDTQGHVNNAAAVVILQEGRSGFNRTAGIAALLRDSRLLVAALRVEYAGEIYHPGMIEISTGVLSLGRSSVTIGQVARQSGASRLYSEAVMVFADRDGPVPLPEPLREAYAGLMIG